MGKLFITKLKEFLKEKDLIYLFPFTFKTKRIK